MFNCGNKKRKIFLLAETKSKILFCLGKQKIFSFAWENNNRHFFTCGNKPNDFFLLGKTKTYFLFLGKTKPDIFSLAESN